LPIFDENLFGPDIKRFRQEMEWIKKETKLLSEDDLIDIIYHNKKFNQMCSMVTFDDGYRDNYDLAFPILKELKIPAMFFIPTYHLSKRKVGWWDLVAYLIKHSTKDTFTFRGQVYEMDNKKALVKNFILELKAIEANQIENYIFDLSLALNLALPDSNLQSSELMTWDQIKIMSDNGMTIGSHSHDHSILSKQDALTLKNQLSKSVEILERNLSKKIRSIAYPVGGYDHFNAETKNITKEIGLQRGFSFLTGVNQLEQIDPFDVKRMSVRPEWLNLDMALAFPNIFLKSHF
jgi:peptidoglycan/xylan/chitin deacetylase (PgdA/CDA1 family)